MSTITDENGQPLYKTVHAPSEPYTKPTFQNRTVMRVGFTLPVAPRYLNNPDYVQDVRPILWPLYHPYFHTGTEADHSTMMAYVEDLNDVLVAWPEAKDLTVFEEHMTHYQYSPRLPEPDWLATVHHPDFVPPLNRTGAYKITNPDEDLSIIGFGDDIDYQIQHNNLLLEFGKHEHEAFQQAYTGWQDLEISVYDTTTVEQAKAYAQKLLAFENDEGEIPTTLKF